MPPRRRLDPDSSSSSEHDDEELSVKRRRNNDRLTPTKRTRVNGHSRDTSRTPQRGTSRDKDGDYIDPSGSSGSPSTPKARQMARRSGGRPLPKSVPSRLQVEVEIPIRRSSATRRRSLEPQQGVAGPGPETLRSLEQRGLAPVPQPSPSVFRPYLRGGEQGGAAPSQMESIGDFSSPPIAEEDSKPSAEDKYRLVDGEEALVASDSDDDIEVIEVKPAPPPPPASAPRHSASPDPDPDQDESSCQWAGCVAVLSSALELARHVRDHADEIDPSDEVESNSTLIPSQLVDDPVIHHLKAEVEEIHAENLARSRELKMATARAAALSETVALLSGQLKEQNNSAASLNSGRLLELERKILSLEQALKARTTSGLAVQEQLDLELKTTKDLGKQLEKAEEQLEESRGQTEQQLNRQIEQIKSLEQKLKEAEGHRTQSEQQINELRQQMVEADKLREAHVKEKDQLREAHHWEKDQQRKADEQQINELRQQAAEWEKQREVHLKEIEQLRKAGELQRSTAEQELKEEQRRRRERDETIATLLRKIKDLETSIASAAAAEASRAQQAPAAQAPPSTDTPVDNQELEDLKKQLKRANKKLSLTRDDYNYIKSSYDTASSQAAMSARRVDDLEQQVDKLQEQLKFGLKQREMFNTAVVQQYKDDAKLARQQLELLQEQNRRTDDKVRQKASLYKPVQREKETLEIELHKARDEATMFRDRNNELVEQVALLRGRLMGAFDDPEPEAEAELEGEPDAEASPPPEPERLRIPTFAPDDDSSPAVVRDACLTDGGIEAFRCKWAVGDAFCPEIFQTRDDLETHGLEHVSNLQGGSQL